MADARRAPRSPQRKEGRKGERLSEGKTGVLDSLSIPTLLLTSRKA